MRIFVPSHSSVPPFNTPSLLIFAIPIPILPFSPASTSASLLLGAGTLLPIGDEGLGETIANMVTSLPFIVLGLQSPRKNLNCKLYANSLIGVGSASSLYHSSRGKLRKYFRWADYKMIATATVCLSRALRNENPKLLMAASAFFPPIQPLMVSAVHTGMVEVAFAKRALDDPELRMVHNVHKMSSLLGGALFIADELSQNSIPSCCLASCCCCWCWNL